tara:strand:- start:99 stop:269 length:171 start_codon:yes stop_codon:yes gene_type:complete
MNKESQSKYSKTQKGKEAISRAQERYDVANSEKRKKQKRDYMRRKRAENPNYCKWK